MCQAKSSKYPNGKRCLKHSKVSQYVIRVVMQRFGIDERTASSMLSELDKEGKHLPMASVTDAQAQIDEWNFETATDEQISEHERLIRMNQLEKAREETKNGIAGSRLYAWKNLAKRVSARLRKFAVVGFLTPTLILTGCSAGTITSPQPTSSTGTSTSQTASPTSSPETSTPSDVKTVPGNGQVVKDKYGSYEHAAPVDFPFDPEELVNNSWKEVGFAQSDVKSAHKWISEFVSTQGVDSSALDGTDRTLWDSWVKNEAAKYVYKDNLADVTRDHDDVLSGIIYNNPKDAITPVARDGNVRISKEDVYINSITGYNNTGYKRLQLDGSVTASYRVSPESAIAALKKARPKATEAELKKQFPKAFNAKEDKLTIIFDFAYSIRPDGDSWKITGYSNQYKTTYAYN